MAVDEMTYEDWDRNINRGGLVRTPEWTLVEQALHGLDGHRRTLVTLEVRGRVLMVGGGAERRYVVVATEGDQSWSLFVGARGPMVPMVVGGQLGDYPEGMVVSLEKAKETAKSFFERNVLDVSAGWQKD
jgi:hypothetical protein